jgi:hypothetical protein
MSEEAPMVCLKVLSTIFLECLRGTTETSDLFPGQNFKCPLPECEKRALTSTEYLVICNK